MKTSTVIKNIEKCQRHKPIKIDLQNEVGRIISQAADQENYLETGFMEEAEGLEPLLPPRDLLAPIF